MNIVRTPGILHGFPCFEGTRIPFDVPLSIVDNETIHPDDIGDYYPNLDASAYEAAISFYIHDATPRERLGLIEHNT